MKSEPPWLLPKDGPLTAEPNTVHVWCVQLDIGPRSLHDYWGELSTDERQRGERFHFDVHRERFVVCRAQLRRILSRYLPIGSAEIRFEYEPLGKPKLCAKQTTQPLHFNVSKSDEIAIIGITPDRNIGIDVERIRPVADAEQLAERYFSAAEYDRLCRLADEQRNHGFLSLWTYKEAFLKATGRGLTFPLDQISIALDGEAQPRIEAIKGSLQENDWQITRLIPANGYVGALATPGAPPTIARWYCPH